MNKDELKLILNVHTEVLAEVLKIKYSEFQWEFWSDFKIEYPNYSHMIVPSAMITPIHLNDIYEPFIVINDEYYDSNGSSFHLIQMIAHELRHVWQFYENKQKWNRELELNPLKVNKDTSSITEEGLQKYTNLEIEQDAFAFQIAYAWMISKQKNVYFGEEIMGKFPVDFLTKVNKIYDSYIHRFQRTIKKLGLIL